MTPAERRYQQAGLQLRIATARLLLQVARDGVSLADLQEFGRVVGGECAADSLIAFRAAQVEGLRAAQAELARLPAE